MPAADGCRCRHAVSPVWSSMGIVQRRVDMLLSAAAGGEVGEGDDLLLEVDRSPIVGELTLVRRGRVEMLCRWNGEDGVEVVGVVIGVKRKL